MQFNFGKFKLNLAEVFFLSKSKLSFGFVNLRPIVSGHVLVSPYRKVARFTELSSEEVADLWLSAQTIGKTIEKAYKASSLSFVIQDGAEAGQSVEHVHIHILPRLKGDFKVNDEIYDKLDNNKIGKTLKVDEESRVNRNKEAKEAKWLRGLLYDESLPDELKEE